MRIALDVSPLSRPPTGVGNYLRGLAAGLAGVLGPEDELVAFAPASGRGARAIAAALADLPLAPVTWRLPYPHAWRAAWSRAGRPALERLLGPVDVLHFSDWMYPPQRAGLRATTVYDLVPLRFPQWTTGRTRRMARAKLAHAAARCDLVFAISEFTAADVVERLGVPAERVRVAYPGLDPCFEPEGPRAGRPAPYLLTVSTLEPRKNLGVLLDAFGLLRRQQPGLELLVVGSPGWGEQPELARAGVVALGYVPLAALAPLYRGAAAFAFPSRFEGFGLPVAEAMACGTPAVVSAHPSLDEVAGEAALRADPASPEAWAAALSAALAGPPGLRERGRAHAARFTREACGRAVLDGYRSFL